MGSNCLVNHILQNIFFCVQQKKEIHTTLEQIEGEHFPFWVSYTFKICLFKVCSVLPLYCLFFFCINVLYYLTE